MADVTTGEMQDPTALSAADEQLLRELTEHASRPGALTSGFSQALTACGLFLIAAAVIATRTARTRAHAAPSHKPVPATDTA